MALNFFTQKDIAHIDINNIPEEFINYFEDLNNIEKERIIEFRPDLVEALGYKKEETQLVSDYNENDEKEIILDNDVKDKVSEFDLSEISKNIYDGKNLCELVKTELNPLDLLTVREDQEKCKIHGRSFKELCINYLVPSDRRPGKMSHYGIALRFCCDCNRLYVKEGRVDKIKEELSKVNKTVHVYSLEETDAYIRSQMSERKLSTNESIYVPDIWIEDNPVCTIHNVRIEEYPYAILYGNKKVKFNAYFCEKCKKIILRKTKALDLEDKCAEVGIPMPPIDRLTNKKIKEKNRVKGDLKIDYFVENGKRKTFSFDNLPIFNFLDESDTVIVSDSIYCNLIEHNTDEVMIVFSVNQKRHGIKNYLCQSGYCDQCQKYYISEDDYKVIYSYGRAEINIINDTEDSNIYITSGEVFELEKKHLENLESDLKKKSEEIKKADDYVNPYETIKGGYDDGGLHFEKARSKEKYGETLEKLYSYMKKPYGYRVDLTCDKDNIIYYVGPTDIQIDDDTRVISYNDRSFGAKLVNTRTIDIDIDGKNYKVKLSRKFDIDNEQLYGYLNLITDEDIIFRKGITDPYLIKVLNLRKKQHSLVDIIATIQENQNAIVDEKFHQSIIVQGCAGSGKTMVLLHRLSSLKYNNPEYDFDKALILTPNEQFSLHIKGLAEELQIGFINRVSVEGYYIQILRDFDVSFVPQNAISSEVFVNQTYVDYIYSDAFKADFDSAYEKVLRDRYDTFAMLKDLCETVFVEYPTSYGDTDSEYIPIINQAIRRISIKVEAREREIDKAKKLYKKSEKRLKDVLEYLPEVENKAIAAFSEAIPKVYTKLGGYLLSLQHSVEEQQAIINNVTEEIFRLERQIFIFGKKDKLSELKKISDKAESKIKSEQAKIEEARALLENIAEGKTEEEIFECIRKTVHIIPDIRDEIRNYERYKKELPELKSQISELEVEIINQKNQYETVAKTGYSDNIKKKLNYLSNKAEEYSEFNTFKMVFNQAVDAFKKTNNVKVNKGIRRYDLYAAILFCIKFYGKLPGTAHFICVDEGQDISINEYRLIYLLNQKDVVFNIYGDVNQLLKPGRGISNWTELKKEFSMKEFQLNENYRNTNQITRFCNSSFEMNVMQTGVDGAKIREIPRRELEKKLAEINLRTEKIAILVPRSVRRKNYLVMDNLPTDIRNAIGQKIDNESISFMYVDEVKGIEFDKVFVVSNKMTKNEKYIAYTRALSELIIVVDESIVLQEAQEE